MLNLGNCLPWRLSRVWPVFGIPAQSCSFHPILDAVELRASQQGNGGQNKALIFT
jgi:hypothetical protein